MIFDRTERFSLNQPITTTGTTYSTNVFDSGNPGTVLKAASQLRRDLGKGTPLPLGIRITQGFNNLTGFQVLYQVADDAGFTTNLTTTYQSPVYTLAQVQPGVQTILPDSVPVDSNRRYHRLAYVVTGTAPTLGTITAGFVAGTQTNTIL